MAFEWDEEKNASNREKHGLRFEHAALVFRDPGVLSYLDDRFDYGEERWVTIGRVESRSFMWLTRSARTMMAKKSSVSYPQGKRRRVKDDSIYLDEEGRAELKKLKDRPIDLGDPDAPEIEEFMVRERGKFYRPVKQQITLRLDKDVIAWFKARGDKYQTRINEALREYIRLQARRG